MKEHANFFINVYIVVILYTEKNLKKVLEQANS